VVVVLEKDVYLTLPPELPELSRLPLLRLGTKLWNGTKHKTHKQI
jgi:hypothetical protein